MLIIAVGLTTMGPIFHYTGYTVAIIFILFYKKNNIPQIMSDVWHHNKLNIILLFILILYLTISYYITATNLSSYLKNISIPLEMCIGVFLSIIILDTKEKIKTFTNAVAIMMVMTIIFLYIQFYFGYSIRSIYVMTTYYGLGWITCCLASYVLYYMFFNKAKKIYFRHLNTISARRKFNNSIFTGNMAGRFLSSLYRHFSSIQIQSRESTKKTYIF